MSLCACARVWMYGVLLSMQRCNNPAKVATGAGFRMSLRLPLTFEPHGFGPSTLCAIASCLWAWGCPLL